MSDWRSEAACTHHDPDLWHPPPGSEAESLALAICRHCPVLVECDQLALENGEEFGIYGGRTERQRRAGRRNNPTKRCATCRNPYTYTPSTRQKYCSTACRKAAAAAGPRLAPVTRPRAWSADEDRHLVRMLLARYNRYDIANQLHRTKKAVDARLLLLRRNGRIEVNA